MPVEIIRTTTQLIKGNLQTEPETSVSVQCKMLCDGPNCQKSDSSCRGAIEWNESKPGEGIPDEAWRVITQMSFAGDKRVFFSRECLRDYMRSYVPPLSPREQAAQQNSLLTPEAKQLELFTEKDLEAAIGTSTT